ncbi:MAG TPA: S8 family serine peptidase [Steroidobacteraceae bacterium]|nr:S8 family serine peptidase [Steroidobacteraceae bacterium]
MNSKRVGHGHVKWAVCAALLSATTLAAAAEPRALRDGSSRISSLALKAPVVMEARPRSVLHPSLQGLTGRQQVLVRLRGESVAGSDESVTREQVLAEQAAFINRVLGVVPSAEVISSTQLAINAVVLEVDAADLPALARDTAITRVVEVGDYRLDLSETVPYIGADTAHDFGARGQGVRIAVIDSGVDYTHKALGGPGTQAAYEAAWAPLPPAGAPAIPVVAAGTGYLVANDPATAADDGLFPGSKVIGGYDYVGERWTGGANSPPLAPDPDPIGAPDATTNGGHGTHVADIIAGKLGVAPGAKLYAIKACSAPGTSCSGIALLDAMDFALDPNGDGRIRDRVDIINMSLGSDYGQPFDDDLSAAVDNASKVGVLTVASAGNGSDKQFITGSPAAASSALSVAQTEVPSSTLQLMTLIAPVTGDRAAVHQPWSGALGSIIEGPVTVFPAGTTARTGCTTIAPAGPIPPWPAGSLNGKIVFVDRGACNFSEKIQNIQAAGGILGIIGLVTPEAPFAGAFGVGAPPTIPGYMINQADGDILRGGNAVVRFDPLKQPSLAGSLASTSSRGPRFDDNIVKPEIGAPGASISAGSGSFTGTSAFGGTSGAAPMVTGAAAVLKAARPFLKPREIKQLLINTAETNVYQPSSAASVLPDQLAPITRIGGGEVRVDRALFSPVIVSDVTGDAVSRVHGAMSFGYLDASKPSTTLTRKLEVENHSFFPLVYKVKSTLRHQDDKDTGAVSISVSPSTIYVGPFGSAKVTVKLNVDGTRLRPNLMNSSTAGNNSGPLTANEYDGYIVFDGLHHKVTMPWHILPRKSADVVAKLPGGHLPINSAGLGSVSVENKGVGDAQMFAYSMLGTGTNRPGGAHGENSPTPDIRAVGVNTFGVPAGFCAATENFIWEFAFNMFERPTMPIGTWHEVDLDVDGDGGDDFQIYTRDVSGDFGLEDGRQATAVYDVNAGTVLLRSDSFTMEHATNSSTLVMRICGSDLGMTLADIGRPVSADFRAISWYWGTPQSHLGPFKIAPGGEEFSAGIPGAVLGYKQKGSLDVRQWGLFPGTDPHAGLLLINNSAFSDTNNGGATAASEAILLPR